ncbi:MAG TPA: translation initiation factor IF-2 [Syntrophomonadaceae bacterium]|nr:translation initiation factor IF-2 [Syntrophomonadaceae bacterium]
MAKIRVHELAKEIGVPSKEMVDILQGLGLDIKNHMSTMEDSQAAWAKKRLGKQEAPGPGKDEASSREASHQEAKKPAPSKSPEGRAPVAGPSGNSPSSPSSNLERSNTPSSRPAATPSRPAEQGMPANRPAASAPGRNASTPDRPGVAPRRPDDSSRPGGPGPARQDDRRTFDNRGPGAPRAPQDQQRPPQGQQRPFQGQQSPAQGQQRPPQQGQRPPQGQGQRPPQGQRPYQGQQGPAQGQQRPFQQGQRPPQGQGQRPPMNNGQRPPQGQGQRPPMGGGQRPPQGQGQRPPIGGGQRPTQPRPGVAAAPAPGQSPGRPPLKKGPGKPMHPGQNRPPIKRPEGAKDYSRPQRKSRHKKRREETVLTPPSLIQIEDTITVRELGDKLNRSPADIMKKLMELGIMATINQPIDFDTAEILASLYESKVERVLSAEQKLLEEIVDDQESLKTRPPVVTVMGHVDHGKTSLLDRIRKANVVSGEAGGITQHIGAYQVTARSNRITFIDTPGHEAFTAMRARGANLTDIVVLVVAADDGVMPQTIEAINHIRAARVPFLVAVNKIDKPAADAEKVMRQLTEHGILAEEWGGDIIFVPVSAKTGEGLENLLEMILLLAEMHDIKANPDRPAEGVVVEGELDKGRGPIATVLVQKGTLKVGDYLVAGVNWCKVRAMTDYRGRRVDKALPSMPIELTGWSGVPEAGSKVQACDEKTAKTLTSMRVSDKKIEEQSQSSRISLDDFFRQMKETESKDLNLIVKGDVQGSIEALIQSLVRLSTDEVKVNVIHSAVGAITETDVMLASASNAIIIGFNVRPETKARLYAEEEKIDVRLYRVIYEAIEDVKKAMVGLLDPEFKEKYLGRAEVRVVFKVPNFGSIGGSYVLDGKIQRNASVRILRDGVIVFEGKLSSLKRFKDDAKEVVENYECGIGIKDFNDIKEGDVVEAFTMEEVPREL